MMMMMRLITRSAFGGWVDQCLLEVAIRAQAPPQKPPCSAPIAGMARLARSGCGLFALLGAVRLCRQAPSQSNYGK